MSNVHTPLLLVGCGNMGSALARGWRASLLDAGELILVDPHIHSCRALASALNVACYESIAALPADTPISSICLATKPDALEAVLASIRQRFQSSNPLVLSIAAGKPLSFYSKHLWDSAAIIRVMPNTPSMVLAGMSACVANPAVTASQRQFASALMDAVGKTLWVDDESLMDAVTAISGSGPAYVFYFMECLIDAAIDAGLTPEQAAMLCTQTLFGAAQLAATASEPPSQLRENVTSKGGTTQAALSVLMSDSGTGFRQIIIDSVAAAKKRSLEMSGL